jgi:hypothetical protein
MAALVWRETQVRDKVEMPPGRFSLRSAPWLQAKKNYQTGHLIKPSAPVQTY